MVVGTGALPPYVLPQPDFYLARDAAGQTPGLVASKLRAGGLERAFKVTTQVDRMSFIQPSVTALNLGPLGGIESVGAGLIAAVGVAVLGAFLVLERRREFATLEAMGADSVQVLRGPAQEGALTVAGSLLVGIPLGIVLSTIAVRLLGLFFTLPPPLVTVPSAACWCSWA